MAQFSEYIKISWYNANKKVGEKLFLQPFVFLKEIWYNNGYDTGVIEETTKNHCVKCVAVNKCCFKEVGSNENVRWC